MGRRRRGVSWAVGLALALGALVLAAPALGGYHYEIETFTANDAAQTGEEATCGSGVAIGGGVSAVSPYAEGVYVNTSRPGTLGGSVNKNGWTIYVDNYVGGTGARTPRVYAVCDDNAEDSDYRIRQEAFTVPDNAEGGKAAKCRQGEFAVGGGATTSGFYPDEQYLSTSAPFDGPDPDKRPGDGWRAEINNDEDGAGDEVAGVVYALCDRKHDPSDFRYVRKTRKVPDGEQKFRLVSCKGSETLVGGGVRSRSAYEHGLYINTSFPNSAVSPSLWSAAVDNYDTPDDKARKITTTAICR